MTQEDFEPAATLEVDDLAVLKVISDPLRARLVDLLRGAALTVKELAPRVELTPKQLYYHINLLERHGLIRVVETRLVSGIVEKRYRAVARLFLFSQDVFAAQQSNVLPEGIALLFETTRNQLARSVAAGVVPAADLIGPEENPHLLMAWTGRRISAADATAFCNELAALYRRFAELPQAEDGVYLRLFGALFPIAPDA